ncbi:MAG: DUF1847 domain-containing protein [Deltaproteobacteria bacterium]|nr:DUF1847 domain-containing protein [Deltaproteobacteria bacterium]
MNETKPILSPCRSCKKMVCRTHGRDCYNVRDDSKDVYLGSKEILANAKAASALVDNGRAGQLNRIEEIIEFCRERLFQTVGVAYCFGIKNLAMEFCQILENAGFNTVPVSCTSGAVMEREIDSQKQGDVVSCNPAGQALVLNQKKPDFVVEMGLCLGHDVIFHETLMLPFTVLMVKDRTVRHHPASLFFGYEDLNTAFLKGLDDSFAMKSPQWLFERLTEVPKLLTIIDFRSAEAFQKAHIQGSMNMLLKELPNRLSELDRHKATICVCNGSVQSAYGIMFLFSRGFGDVHNLSGGFSRWQRDGFPSEASSQ